MKNNGKTTEKLIEIKINNELAEELLAKAIIKTIKIFNIISYIVLFISGITFFIGSFLEIWNFTKYSIIAGAICCAWLGLVALGYYIIKRK